MEERMHDPQAVAFTINFPWYRTAHIGKTPWRYWHPFITIWHVDPETDGSDDSCDWFGSKLTRENGWYPADVDYLKQMPDERREAVLYVWHRFRHRLGRRWWRHPRYHVHHLKFQIHPLQHFKRWAFSRCCKCGKGFRWGSSVCTDQWYGDGPQWFKSEEKVYHGDCSTRSMGLAVSAKKP
jgi:hypothetical protein